MGSATPFLFETPTTPVLGRFVDRTCLLAFDLDGTLAPIVDHPSRARVPAPLQRELTLLCATAPVAVITGRSRGDAQARLGFAPRFLVGNHGAEGLPGHEAREGAYASVCRTWADQLGRLLPAAELPGVLFEDKGTTLSIHYRHAPDAAAARTRILEAIGRLAPEPRRVTGHSVENIVPPGAPDKGEALLVLLARSGCARAVFVGDDETDEDVFRRGDPRILGIHVGIAAPTHASFRLRDQRQVTRLVTELRRLVESSAAPGA